MSTPAEKGISQDKQNCVNLFVLLPILYSSDVYVLKHGKGGTAEN